MITFNLPHRQRVKEHFKSVYEELIQIKTSSTLRRKVVIKPFERIKERNNAYYDCYFGYEMCFTSSICEGYVSVDIWFWPYVREAIKGGITESAWR